MTNRSLALTRAAAPRIRPAQQRVDVLIALTLSDLRVRYGRGGIRVVKWLLDPFAALGVYLLLVSFAVSKPGAAPGLSLACSIVPFQLVIATAVNAMSAVQARRSIVLNMGFDRALIPVSSVLTEATIFLADLVLVVMTMAIYSVKPTLAIFWFPIVLAATVVLALGIAYPCTIFGVWYSDLRLFGVSVIRTSFFLATGLVPLAQVDGKANTLLKLNPLTELFEGYRDVFLYGRAPHAANVLYPLAFAAALILAFAPLYRREQQQFAKVVD